MKRIPMRQIICLFIIISSISCSPSKLFIVTTDANKEKISQVANVGIISDVCLAKDPMFKKDYLMVEESKQAETYLMQAAKTDLKLKGYQVDYSLAPCMGGFKTSGIEFRVADVDGGKVTKRMSPFYFPDSVNSDEEYKEALITVISKSLYAIADKKASTFPTEEGVRKSLDIIADRTGLDMILVLLGNGIYVNPGKSITQGVTIGLATTILTLGLFTYYMYNVSYLDSYAGIIDLKTGEFLWTNSMRLSQDNVKKQHFYDKYWSKHLLYYFPLKK
jgi:hypothetical protein